MPIIFFSATDEKRKIEEAKRSRREELAFDPAQPRDLKGSATGGEWVKTIGSYKLSIDKSYIRHDAQAKKDMEHYQTVSQEIPEHLKDYIAKQDKNVQDKIALLREQQSKFEFGTKEYDAISEKIFTLEGLEPENISKRTNKLNDFILKGKKMKAKFKGVGALTGRPINIGDEIYYVSGVGAEHIDRIDQGRPK